MPPDELDMVWMISAFRGDHSLHSELPIGKDQLAKFREVVAPDPDDPWYMFSYPVPLDAWSKVNEILSCGPPEPDLEYFISGYAADR